MSDQKLLDPAQIGELQGTWNPPGPLPPRMREFGFVPNFNQLKPGDLLLVSTNSSRLSSRLITEFQKIGGYSDEHARWQHAAIYLGDGYICEATLHGVIRTQIYKYCLGTDLLRFRRVPGLTVKKRYELAMGSLNHLGYRYAFGTLLNLAWASALIGFWNLDSFSPRQRRLICSELFANAYTFATKRVLGNSDMTPAFLSQTSELLDVNVQWSSICPVPHLRNVLDGRLSRVSSAIDIIQNDLKKSDQLRR